MFIMHWKVVAFVVLVIFAAVSAKCTKDQILKYFTSSAPPWNNYHRISEAVFPPLQSPSLLIKINVTFVNESSVSVNSTEACNLDSSESNQKFTWSVACLYVIGEHVSMCTMNFFSLLTIWPNRRQTELCIKLPEKCRFDFMEWKQSIYFLSRLQSMAVRPSAPDPSQNTARCVTKGHGKVALTGILNGVCWIILIVSIISSIFAFQYVIPILEQYEQYEKEIDKITKEDEIPKEKKAYIAAVKAKVFLLCSFLIGSIILAVVTKRACHTCKKRNDCCFIMYFVIKSLLFGGCLLWYFYKCCKSKEKCCKSKEKCWIYIAVYPSIFSTIHHVLWIFLGFITEPFWAMLIIAAISSCSFILFYSVYQYHKYSVKFKWSGLEVIVQFIFYFIAFVLLIIVFTEVGQAYFSDNFTATVTQGILVFAVTMCLKYLEQTRK